MRKREVMALFSSLAAVGTGLLLRQPGRQAGRVEVVRARQAGQVLIFEHDLEANGALLEGPRAFAEGMRLLAGPACGRAFSIGVLWLLAEEVVQRSPNANA